MKKTIEWYVFCECCQRRTKKMSKKVNPMSLKLVRQSAIKIISRPDSFEMTFGIVSIF